jgi:thioredoxin-related protein
MKLRRFMASAISIIAVALWSLALLPQSSRAESITWYKYDEGVKQAAKLNRLILIDFYTDWCGWCKKMDKTTFTDQAVVEYINKNFIAIKVNAESNASLSSPDGLNSGVKVARSFGVNSYPQYWFVESNGKKIDKLPGYAPPDRFIIVLKYIGEGEYKKQSWNDYYQKAQGSAN